MTTFLQRIARYGHFGEDAAPVVFDLLVKHGLADDVTRNVTVPFETAKALLSGNLPAADAKVLLSHSWSPEQIDVLLRLEKRRSVIAAAVKNVPLAEATLEYLLRYKHIDGPLADDVLENQQLNDVFKHRFSLFSQQTPRVRATADAASDKDGIEALKDLLRREVDIFNDYRMPGLIAAISAAIAEHPETLELINEDIVLSPRVRVAMATCIHLTDPALQRRLADIGGTTPRSGNDVLVLLYLSVHPYLSRAVAEELKVELAVRESSARRLPIVVGLIDRRLGSDLFMGPSDRARDCSSEMFQLLRNYLVNDAGRVRSRELLVELAYHADVNHVTADTFLRLLARFSGPGVEDATVHLLGGFPGILVHTQRDSSEPSRAARRHNYATEQVRVAAADAQKAMGHVAKRRPPNVGFVAEYGALTLLASQRLGSDRQKWQTFLTLVSDFDDPLEQLFNVCDVL